MPASKRSLLPSNDPGKLLENPFECLLGLAPPDVASDEQPTERQLLFESPEPVPGCALEPEQAPHQELRLRHQHPEQVGCARGVGLPRTAASRSGTPTLPRYAPCPRASEARPLPRRWTILANRGQPDSSLREDAAPPCPVQRQRCLTDPACRRPCNRSDAHLVVAGHHQQSGRLQVQIPGQVRLRAEHRLGR